jgi:hypothetical protein
LGDVFRPGFESVRLVALSADPFRGETRILGPLAAWSRRGLLHATYFSIGIDSLSNIAFRPDIALVTAGCYALERAGLEACRAAGMRLVHDMSEPTWLLPANAPGRPVLDEGALRAHMDACALVTVPTQAQAEAVRAFGVRAPIAIVPDAPDPAAWRAKPLRAARSRPRIGWVGLPGAHGDDLALLEAIVRATEPHLEWQFFGDVPPALRDRALGEQRLHERVDPVLYATVFAQLDLDAVAAVRVDSAYNRTKDDLIVRQAAQLGYAVVASDRPAFAGLPIARLPDDPAAWARALLEFAREPARAQTAAATLAAAIDAAGDYERMCSAAFAAWTGAA